MVTYMQRVSIHYYEQYKSKKASVFRGAKIQIQMTITLCMCTWKYFCLVNSTIRYMDGKRQYRYQSGVTGSTAFLVTSRLASSEKECLSVKYDFTVFMFS